jgi:hypothetical protein
LSQVMQCQDADLLEHGFPGSIILGGQFLNQARATRKEIDGLMRQNLWLACAIDIMRSNLPMRATGILLNPGEANGDRMFRPTKFKAIAPTLNIGLAHNSTPSNWG